VKDVQLVYNSFGQLTADYQSHSGPVDMASTASVGYTYEDGSSGTIRRTGVVYPDGRVIGYQYASGADDAFNRVTAIVDGASASAPVLAQYTRLGLNQFVQTDYPQPSLRCDLAFGTGPDPCAGLDQFGRIVDLRWWNTTTGQDVERVQHGYDPAGNRLWRRNPVAASLGANMDELYGYDGMSQLTSFARGQLTSDQTALASGTETFAQAWSLDPTGNWSKFQQDSTGSGTWDLDQPRTHNAVNEITAFGDTSGPQWSSPAFDQAGNMTALPQPNSPVSGFVCTYDAWNRLVLVADASSGESVAQYQYDGRGYQTARSSTAAGTTAVEYYYYSDQWQLLQQSATDGGPAQRQFIWGLRYIDDLVLRDRDTTGDSTLDERLYAVQDANWNVTALCDSTGAVAERYGYYAYGNCVVLGGGFDAEPPSAYGWEHLFTGRPLDGVFGLICYRERHYDAGLGRFLARDPLGAVVPHLTVLGVIDGGAGISANLYRYAGNSPANRTDPLGLLCGGDPPMIGPANQTGGSTTYGLGTYGGVYPITDSLGLSQYANPSSTTLMGDINSLIQLSPPVVQAYISGMLGGTAPGPFFNLEVSNPPGGPLNVLFTGGSVIELSAFATLRAVQSRADSCL
jgi:RHS repeat-associated protein